MFGFFKRKNIIMSVRMFSSAVTRATRILGINYDILNDKEIKKVMEQIINAPGISIIKDINYIIPATTLSIYNFRDQWNAISPRIIAYKLTFCHCSLWMDISLENMEFISEEINKYFWYCWPYKNPIENKEIFDRFTENDNKFSNSWLSEKQIESVATQYCECIKLAFETLNIPREFPLDDKNINDIFEKLMWFDGCALAKSQHRKELVKKAKADMIEFKRCVPLPFGSIVDVTKQLIREHLTEPVAVSWRNPGTINIVIEKHFLLK